MTPREQFEHNFKVEGQGTAEEFAAFNKREKRIRQLEKKWKPFQKTIDILQKKYADDVRAVEAQSGFIPEEIDTLLRANVDQCPHPVENQTFSESQHYDDYDQHWTHYQNTRCSLCNKVVRSKTV